MCRSCTYYGCWLSNCSDGRGPAPSPPTPPARPVSLHDYSPAPKASGYSHPSTASHRSHESVHARASEASVASVDSAETINSLHSLQSLARHISAELYPQETLVDTLRTWLASVDPESYRQEYPWVPEVLAAYNEYKRLAVEHGAAHTAFTTYLGQTRRNTTAEQHLERARLAVAWGEAALEVATGRLAFIEAYRYAYSSTNSVETHIETGVTAINSGRNAVAEARHNYNALWVAFSRAANPQIFE